MSNAKLQSVRDERMVLDEAAIDAARRGLECERDSTTKRLLEDILIDEQRHAEELRDWLAD